ncbi:hypothetical protein TNCV_2831791 [Trichonephila clavipes]|nr:hypothetical protein TNCV_2831791 [Trichonephila clavipes]
MWLHFYTDGSAQNDDSAGEGFYCENLFECSLAAWLGATNFGAEIEAVIQALCLLTNSSTFYRQAVFLINSHSAILTLSSLRNSDSIEVEEQHLHRIGVKDSPDCPLCLCGKAMKFSPGSLCFPGQDRFYLFFLQLYYKGWIILGWS